MKHTKPTTKPVARRKRGTTTYHLYDNTELWTTGRYAYFCGYVSCPEGIDAAIDAHEEELACITGEAFAEFGGGAA